MAGTISLSVSQQFDSLGHPLAGGQLHFYQATTSTPQNAFYDLALTLPFPNPYILDAAGRIPQFFLADGFIKIELTDKRGITAIKADNLLVLGPSSGGGGGPSVDPTTIFQTGDLKPRYGTGVHNGWVRANGRTIGNATSGASERANADTQALWIYLYNTDANLAVSGGRTGNALNDYNAGKTIALPDWRGRALAGLDDMGSSPANRLTISYFGAVATVLGAASGGEYHVLNTGELPASPPIDGSTTNNLVLTHSMRGSIDGGTSFGNTFRYGNNTGLSTDFNLVPSGTVTVTGNLGLGAAHPIVQPTGLATIYVKL